MPGNSDNLDWVRKGSVVIFTGILGTGSIFGLKQNLVRDAFTAAVFWIVVVAFALSVALGLFLRRREELSTDSRMKALIAAMLICLSLGLVGTGILTTMRNWS